MAASPNYIRDVVIPSDGQAGAVPPADEAGELLYTEAQIAAGMKALGDELDWGPGEAGGIISQRDAVLAILRAVHGCDGSRN